MGARALLSDPGVGLLCRKVTPFNFLRDAMSSTVAAPPQPDHQSPRVVPRIPAPALTVVRAPQQGEGAPFLQTPTPALLAAL